MLSPQLRLLVSDGVLQLAQLKADGVEADIALSAPKDHTKVRVLPSHSKT